MAFCLVDLNKSFTFASDDESQKRLVARHRVFFDANYSRTRRLERSLIRNPQNSKSPELPLFFEILLPLPPLLYISICVTVCLVVVEMVVEVVDIYHFCDFCGQKLVVFDNFLYFCRAFLN